MHLHNYYPGGEWPDEATELILPGKRRQSRQVSYDPEDRILDAVNLRLLAELQASPRLPTAELARRIGMSAPAVAERVQRLERVGVIAGHHLEINPAAVGLPVTAFARIRPMPGSLPKIAELAAQTPQVTECYRITGEDCFLIKLHAPAIEQLEAILDRFLAYGNTTTSIVVSTPVPRRQPPLPSPESAS
jgi:Lrp/AsnC family transcriptional regulator, leucine-responsive regulatory protein